MKDPTPEHQATVCGSAPVPLYHIPHKLMAVGDGTFLLVPSKPIAKLTIAEVARATRMHPKNIHRLIESGILTAEQPSPKVWLIAWDDVAQFLEQTKQPGFWDEVKRRAFISGSAPFHAARDLGPIARRAPRAMPRRKRR